MIVAARSSSHRFAHAEIAHFRMSDTQKAAVSGTSPIVSTAAVFLLLFHTFEGIRTKMTTLTKLLPPGAAPAKIILEKAHPIVLTSAERADCPKTLTTEAGEVTIAVEEMRPLEVGDVFVDEKGAFWVVRPGIEKVLHVTGDVDVMREAVAALVNRGVRVAQAPDGFAVLPLPNLAQMLAMVGLTTTEVESEFDPIQFVQRGCCGHHHHEGCGCGHHHHDHEHGEGCCCGHDHEHEEGCGCGHHHHHDHSEGECCCGGHGHEHGHEHGEGCCCGHDHGHEESCGCGHHHHDHGEGECCCGGHGHEHAHEHGEGCCCGHDHGHEESCGCGHHHHDHGEGECCCDGHGHDHEHADGCCCGKHKKSE